MTDKYLSREEALELVDSVEEEIHAEILGMGQEQMLEETCNRLRDEVRNETEPVEFESVEFPLEPGRLSVLVWGAVSSAGRTFPDIHTLDSDFPVITTREIRDDLEDAQTSLRRAIELLEENEEHYDD